MKIVHYPDPILRNKTSLVKLFDKQLFLEVQEMFKIMEEEKGIGLAANQVGLDKSIFILKIPFVEQNLTKIFINTKVYLSGDKISFNEGCLSFPGVSVEVPRFKTCKIFYQDLAGGRCKEIFTGLPAIVCQHEIDHLNGKTFIDNLASLTQQQICDKLGQNDQNKKTQTNNST